ncbi:MAG: GPW/gp25 family protein [Nitrospira sp.]|nr:GPW/gp25 family protein [Nitrospira sp.]MCW5783298.1 GPW/gp25 family protein [Nitrospirales bacterium]
MSMEILGKGWKFPISLDKGQGGVAWSRYEEKIKESIYIILATAKGERVMRPDFGCGIHDFVFAVMNSATITLMKSTVQDALIQWEPRVTVKAVEVLTDQLGEGIVNIRVDYQVIATNNQFNMVYPFYLTGGK